MKNSLMVILVLGLVTSCTTVKTEKGNVQTPQNAEIYSESTVFIPMSLFVDPSNNQLEDLVVNLLLPKSTANLKNKLDTLPKFPPNSYSGCHARAHFDYLQLKEAGEENIYKVWLFSSSLISPAIGGAISFTPENGNTASWDYHVAVAYTDINKDEWIVDRLISEKPILISEWIDKFVVDGYAVLTRSQPEYYLFNKTSVPASDPVNFPNGFLAHFVPKNVFNGTFYTYSGLSAEQHWGASDLAADSLSSALQNGEFSSCSWKDIASQSLELKQVVSKDSIPAECVGAKSLYNEKFETWIGLGL